MFDRLFDVVYKGFTLYLIGFSVWFTKDLPYVWATFRFGLQRIHLMFDRLFKIWKWFNFLIFSLYLILVLKMRNREKLRKLKQFKIRKWLNFLIFSLYLILVLKMRYREKIRKLNRFQI